jgi:hypothetical protein
METRLELSAPHATLLRRYTDLINLRRKQKGQEPVRCRDVAGAIVTFVLNHHQESILNAFEEIRTAAFRNKYSGFLEGEFDTATDLPKVSND